MYHCGVQVQADSTAEQLAAAEEAAGQLADAAGLKRGSKKLPGQLLEAARAVEGLQEAKAQLEGSCAALERQLAGTAAFVMTA